MAEDDNRSVPELESMPAEALSAREAELRQEVEQQKHEKAVRQENHQFEVLEKLKVKEELHEYLAEDKEVISELRSKNGELESRISRLEEGITGKLSKERRLGSRRSQRLANMEADHAELESEEDAEDELDSDGNGDMATASEGDSSPPRRRGRPPTKRNAILQNLGNKKQMKKKRRRKSVMKQKYKDADHVQYRCNMLSFLKTMQKIKQRLSESHLVLLQQTPFWPLISAFYNGMISESDCKKSESDINDIIQCYNSNTMCFEFGSTSVSLTPEDISVILGLPHEGETLKVRGVFGVNRYTSDFVERYFKHEKRVKKTLVDDGLEKALRGKRETDTEDVVRLILLELFITFLFCNAGSTIGWKLVKCCEELENISRYSWAKAVADFLSSSLEKTSGQSGPYSAGGCVIVLLFWLCERTNLIQPVEGREGHTPALIKWNIQELHLKLRRMNYFEDVGLSFEEAKEKKKTKREEKGEQGKGIGENEETQEANTERQEAETERQEEAETDRREEAKTDRREEERVLDDLVGSLEDELQAQMSHFHQSSPILKRLNRENEDLERRKAKDLRDKVQTARVEVERAQGKVDRLAEKLERKKEKAIRLKRRLKEEKKEKRKLEKENEILNAEKRSLFESVTKLVEKMEETLDAERKAMRNLVKEKAEVIKENRELKDQLNQECCTAANLGEDKQTQVSPEQSYVASSEKSIRKRVLDEGSEYDKGGESKRKLGDENENQESREDAAQFDDIIAGIFG